MSKMTKKELEKALMLAVSRILTLELSEYQITMYEGKWDEMLKNKVAHFLALAKEKKS